MRLAGLLLVAEQPSRARQRGTRGWHPEYMPGESGFPMMGGSLAGCEREGDRSMWCAAFRQDAILNRDPSPVTEATKP